MTARVVPASGFSRYVHERRGHPLARPRRLDVKAIVRDAKKAWSEVRSHWLKGWELRGDARVPMERAADAILERGELEDDTPIEVIAAAEAMLHRRATLLPLVASRFGGPFALRARIAAERWTISSGREKDAWWWMLTGSSTPTRFLDISWATMRRIVCRVEPAAYDEMRALALAEREKETDASRRAVLDYTFPTEPAWAAEDATLFMRAPKTPNQQADVAPLLASIADERVAIALIEHIAPTNYLLASPVYACDLVVAFEPDAATRVLAALAKATIASGRTVLDVNMQQLACAMTSIVSPQMAAVLAPYTRHARFGRHVVAYFETHAELARDALAKEARSKSIAGDAARALLAGHANEARRDEGTMDDAPELLRDPPWLRARAGDATVELPMLPHIPSIAWEPGERERIAASPAVANTSAVVRDITPEELAELDALPVHQKYVDVWPRWVNKSWLVLELPDERRLALWSAGCMLYYRPPDFLLARFGERALDGLYRRDPLTSDDDRLFSSCLRVDAPRTALVCARVMARRRPWAKRAKAWLAAHAETAAIALIPVAFGRAGRGRNVARRALRWIAAQHPDVVRAVAARYGEAAERAALDFAFGDPLARLDVRPANAAAWLRAAALPPLRTKEGRVLPRRATELVVDVLRARGVDLPYAGIDVLRGALDPRSLEDLAWALFYAWLRHGRKRNLEWMALSLAAFATEDTVMRLAPYVREWTHADPRACVTLVAVLAAIGGDEAKVQLDAIAGDARSDVLKSAVREARDGATDFGLDAPIDLGLDARGEGLLDLGGRVVRVVLDESFVPRVVLPDGRRVAQVPRASKTDDPARVRDATARFNRLRATTSTLVKAELRRLERAMIERQRFTASALEARWAKHPLLVHAARRLVWAAIVGDAVRTFRIVEDGTYADFDDLTIALDPSSAISIPHPIDMSDELRARWGTLFADYEILQPFDQLGRFVFAGTLADAAATLKGLAGTVVPARALLRTLAANGWERAAGRRVATAWRELRANKPGVRAFVTFSPGIALSKTRGAQDQKLNAITVPQSPTLEAIERVELSELVRTALLLRP